MKKEFLFYLTLLFTILNSQAKNDTLFLEKNKYHRIFIEKNKHSNYYNSILDFREFEPVDSTRKIESFGIKSKWIRIHQYKKNYFLYAPCDWIYDLKYVIDDNKIQIKSEELSSFKICSIKRKNNDVFIRYKTPTSKNNELLIIKPFEKFQGIYKFVSINDGIITEYLILPSGASFEPLK